MLKEELSKRRRARVEKFSTYRMCKWTEYDYSILSKVVLIKSKRGKGKTGKTYADMIMMADTETSKKPLEKKDNHIVAWSLCIRASHVNLCTLWGQDPFELVDCMQKIRDAIAADEIYCYWHNFAYDWVFTRKFFISKWGLPAHQLNTKPYYPLFLQFENGFMFKDSLILAQRGLDKWAKDLDVEHKKALGKWVYTRYRTQSDELDADELLYIENDVRAGVECIDKTLDIIGKDISSIPYTSTGIVRDESRKIGHDNHAHEYYVKVAPDWHLQQIMENVFHGGYTHANRHATVSGANHGIYEATCRDFASSYPFCALSEKYPYEAFFKVDRVLSDLNYIKKNSENYAFICKCTFINVRMKDKRHPMPVLSMAKSQAVANAVHDNGRILQATALECWLTDIDLLLIDELYDWDAIRIDNIYASFKEYLPKWFTDYVYQRFEKKTTLKGVDPVLYQIEKGKLNACAYGMIAQKPIKQQITEDYEAQCAEDLYKIDDLEKAWNEEDWEEKYNKHVHNRNSFLPYQWSIWVTAYAQRNLFELGKCVEDGGMWLYSDTDSVYATSFNEEKLEAYNQRCKDKLTSRGYGAVIHKGKEYWLGVAEPDGDYMQFKTIHSKCYCKRPLTARGDNFVMGEDLKITVAGVPKKGAASLKNNIENFKPYFKFDGLTSGKLGHPHIIVPEI